MGRPATEHDAVRRRLVGHGRELIRTRGVGRLALADVARREGLSTPSLYHYFANRRALVVAVLKSEVDELLASQPDLSRVSGGARARLARFMEAQTQYLTGTSPNTVAFVLGAILTPPDRETRTVVGPVFGRAEAVFGEVCAELGRDWPAARRRAVADLLRACLAGLFLMRAVGAEIDPAAVQTELRRRVDGSGRSSSK